MIAMLAVVLLNAGETSIARVPSVEVGSVGLLRFGVDGSVGSSVHFPEEGVMRRWTRTSVRAGYTFNPAWELFGSVSGATLTGPRQIGAQGDTRLGLKWRPGGAGGWFAFDGELLLPAGVDGSFPVKDATSLTLRALAGLPLGSMMGAAWRIDSFLGVDMDRTRHILGELPATPVELFGLGIQRGGSVVGGVAVSGTQGPWMPFAEWTGAFPVLEPTEDSPRLMVSRATAGVRWNLARGVAADAAFDLGLGASAVNDLFRTAPPWDARVGLSIAVDPVRSLGEAQAPATPVVKTVYVEKPAAPVKPLEPQVSSTFGTLEGHVVSTDGTPVRGAIVQIGATRLVTGDDGAFELSVPAGRTVIAVKHADFDPSTLTHEVPAGARTRVDAKIQAKAATGRLLVRVSGTNRRVLLKAEGAEEIPASLKPEEASNVDGLSPGIWRLTFTAEGMLARTRMVEVKAQSMLPVEIALVQRPHASALAEDGLTPAKPLVFNGAEPDAATSIVLDEVYDAIVRLDAPVALKVVALAALSAQMNEANARAKAVRDALVARGAKAELLTSAAVVDPSRKAAPGTWFIRIDKAQ